jgi:Inositol monophosphatase family
VLPLAVRPAPGIVDGYWEYRLKPWDVCAGVLIVEEAGGRVATMDGNAYSVFSRSVLATNDALYTQASTCPLGCDALFLASMKFPFSVHRMARQYVRCRYRLIL